MFLTERAQKLLQKARDTYGSKNQIIVSIEECNELSAILAKFARYHNSDTAATTLKPQVLDEVADVYVVLEHVKAIFNITNTEILERAEKKLLQNYHGHLGPLPRGPADSPGHQVRR